jgi:hypothetical protein
MYNIENKNPLHQNITNLTAVYWQYSNLSSG